MSLVYACYLLFCVRSLVILAFVSFLHFYVFVARRNKRSVGLLHVISGPVFLTSGIRAVLFLLLLNGENLKCKVRGGEVQWQK